MSASKPVYGPVKPPSMLTIKELGEVVSKEYPEIFANEDERSEFPHEYVYAVRSHVLHA